MYAWRHIFDRVCAEHGLEHRFPRRPTPGLPVQVEHFSRTLKDATVRHDHYPPKAELNEQLQAFLLAYNHGKRLKRLRGTTTHEFSCQQRQLNPASFTRDLTQFTLGLYS